MKKPWWVKQPDSYLLNRVDAITDSKGKIVVGEFFDGLTQWFLNASLILTLVGGLLGWALYATFHSLWVLLFVSPFIIPALAALIFGATFVFSYFKEKKNRAEEYVLLVKELERRGVEILPK